MPLNEAQLRAIFKEHDKDGNGRHLSKEELKKAFKKLGSRNPDWRVRRSHHRADADKDGYVTGEDEINELVKYALKLGYRVSGDSNY